MLWLLALLPAAAADPVVSEALWRATSGGFTAHLPDCARPDAGSMSVVVEPEDGVSTDLLAEELAAFAEIEAQSRGAVQARVAYADLEELGGLPGVLRVREPRCPSPKEVVSEGVAEIDPSAWTEAGLSGEGVTVAILDVGFAGFESSPEIPADAALAAGEAGSSSHGLAVAEVVHDLAPAARLRLYQFSTDVEYAARMEQLAEDEVDVVNASIGFDNVAHADGDSPYAQLVDALADRRVLYVAAAGNEVGRYRAGALSDADGDGVVEIDGEEAVEVEGWSGQVEVSFRWSEPFGEAEVDLDLELLVEEQACDRSTEAQSGRGDPYERARCAGVGGPVWARVLARGALPAGLEGWLYAPGGLSDPGLAAVQGTLTLPADARGAFTVGAYAVSSGELTAYSSHGPTDDGRLKPDLAGPCEVSTAVIGREGFGGSSAAAPHAAGLAALLRDRRARADVADLAGALAGRAEDRGPAGPDDGWGAGALRAGEVPRRCGCAAESPSNAVFPLGVLLLLSRRTKGWLASGSGIP